jgi:hypothetical protein
MPADVPSGDTAGHLYMQTNETDNSVVHYLRSVDGKLAEAGRRTTGGSGAGPLNFRSNPMGLVADGAHSMILTSDPRLLLVTNVGDNSVSSFAVDHNGELRLLDVQPTGNTATGQLGTAKSLAFGASSRRSTFCTQWDRRTFDSSLWTITAC